MDGTGIPGGKRMKAFTIERAERALPKVARLVRRAQRIRDKLAILMETNEATVEVSDDSGFHLFVTNEVRVNKEFHRLYYQFYKIVDDLNTLGVIVRDIDEGEVEFPFKLQGRYGFLCWQLGDERIQFWRERDSEEKKPLLNLDEFL